MALTGPYATEAAAIAACSSGGPETWECQCGLVTEDGPPSSVVITVDGLTGGDCPCAPVDESATMYLGTVPAGSFDANWPFGCDGAQGYLFTDLTLCEHTYTFLLYCSSNAGVPGDMELWLQTEEGLLFDATILTASCEPFGFTFEFNSYYPLCEIGGGVHGPGTFSGSITLP